MLGSDPPLDQDLTGPSEEVQKLSIPILREQLLGRIDRPFYGDDMWYQLLTDETSDIKLLKQDDRLDFYAIMLMNLSFNNHAAIYDICRIAENDNNVFVDKIKNLINSERVASLSAHEKSALTAWVGYTQHLENQGCSL